MTEQQQKIVDYLKGKDWTSPTQIALDLGHSNTYNGVPMGSSTWSSPKCLDLVYQGILERNKRGRYRIKEVTKL